MSIWTHKSRICSPSTLTCPAETSLPGGGLRSSPSRAGASMGSDRPHTARGPRCSPHGSVRLSRLSAPGQEGCMQGLPSAPHCAQVGKLGPTEGKPQGSSGRTPRLPLQRFLSTEGSQPPPLPRSPTGLTCPDLGSSRILAQAAGPAHLFLPKRNRLCSGRRSW